MDYSFIAGEIQRSRLQEIDLALQADLALLELAPTPAEREDMKLHIDLMLDERLDVMQSAHRRFRP